MQQERNKVYVLVNTAPTLDVTWRPRVITLEDGRKFEIDRLIHRCRAAATKVGGTGIRYTVSICGKQTYLFDEENGKWFVEFKTV